MSWRPGFHSGSSYDSSWALRSRKSSGFRSISRGRMMSPCSNGQRRISNSISCALNMWSALPQSAFDSSTSSRCTCGVPTPVYKDARDLGFTARNGVSVVLDLGSHEVRCHKNIARYARQPDEQDETPDRPPDELEQPPHNGSKPSSRPGVPSQVSDVPPSRASPAVLRCQGGLDRRQLCLVSASCGQPDVQRVGRWVRSECLFHWQNYSSDGRSQIRKQKAASSMYLPAWERPRGGQ